MGSLIHFERALIELQSSLIQLERALQMHGVVESSLIQLKIFQIQLESSLIQLKSSLINWVDVNVVFHSPNTINIRDN